MKALIATFVILPVMCTLSTASTNMRQGRISIEIPSSGTGSEAENKRLAAALKVLNNADTYLSYKRPFLDSKPSDSAILCHARAIHKQVESLLQIRDESDTIADQLVAQYSTMRAESRNLCLRHRKDSTKRSRYQQGHDTYDAFSETALSQSSKITQGEMKALEYELQDKVTLMRRMAWHANMRIQHLRQIAINNLNAIQSST